jgi:hypothetical protein
MSVQFESAAPVADAPVAEDVALSRLGGRDLRANEIEKLAHDAQLLKSRKVMLAIARHGNTPRHVSMPLVRQLFAFELMALAAAPALPADVKYLAEECIVGKLPTITVGERLTLAKRGSTRIAAALLTDAEGRVRDAALKNPRMTEMWVVRALMKPGTPRGLIDTVQRHPKWSCRVEVRRALEALGKARVRT